MSFPTAFPANSSNLPRAVILTLGTTDGAILIRLHTTDNNLHVFATFVNREHFDTQFLWTNVRPNHITGDFDISHQTVTVAADAQQPFSHIRQNTRHFRVDPTPDSSERGEDETENPPAPPYEPSPSHSPENHTPAAQEADNTGNSEETPAMERNPQEEDDNNSKQYWRAIDNLD